MQDSISNHSIKWKRFIILLIVKFQEKGKIYVYNKFISSKRKMHESQHGIVMVITAYALSVLMLVMGSDVFYNIKSAAAGISIDTDEEIQKIRF